MSLKTTRRRMFQLAAAVPALSFLRQLDKLAMAQGTAPMAKRFLLLYHAMGTSGAHWYGPGNELALGHTLSPLEDVKGDLVVCRNVNNEPGCEYWDRAPASCRMRGLNKVDQHSVATCTLLAPVAPRNPNISHTFPGGETLDWHLGRLMQKKYGVPRDVLFLTPARARVGVVDTFSTRRNAGGALEDPAPLDNPVKVYADHFSRVTPTMPTPGTPDPLAADAAQRERLARQLVTDFTAKEVGEYQKQLPADVRGRLDAHMAELRELEKTLAGTTPSAPATPGAKPICSVVNPSDSLAAVSMGNYRARCEVMADLAVGALSCDIARVVTLSWWTFNGGCAPPNMAGTKTYGNLHEGLQHGRFNYTRQDVADCHQHIAYQTARIIKKLKSIPEGNGTMLDNTLVLWTSDMGMDPFDNGFSHNKRDLPFILAGKSGGRLKTGRLVDFKMASHARLYTAISHLLGFPTDTFGDARYNQGGPVPELLG